MKKDQLHKSETIAKMRQIHSNRSEEWRRKLSESLKGKPAWNKKERQIRLGYVFVWDGDRLIREHRLVMERALGRPLRRDEPIHHKNGNREDNRLENLQLMTSPEHSKLHYHPRSHVPLEERERIRQALLGRKMSQQARQNMRLAQLGRKHSPKTIEKMRLAATGRVLVNRRWLKRTARIGGVGMITRSRAERKRAAIEGYQKMKRLFRNRRGIGLAVVREQFAREGRAIEELHRAELAAIDAEEQP